MSMKKKTAACLLVLLLSALGCAQQDEGKASPAQSQVDALAAELTKGQIVRVEILEIPPRIETRTRITPEMLEEQFHYKLTIRDVRGGLQQRPLSEAIKSVGVKAEMEMADLRWGIIFYSLDDRRLGALYFDKTGRRGGVGTTPVSFRGDLFNWLNENFSTCFR